MFKQTLAKKQFKVGVGSYCKSLVDAKLKFEDIPGPRSYPIIGTLYKYWPFIGEYNPEAMDKIASLNYRRYGSLARELPLVNLLNVFDPDLIEAVFRQDDRYPARRSHVAMYHYRTNKPEVYNTGGLLSTNGPEWWKLRSTFQKNFTSPQSVKSHLKHTDDITKEFITWMKEIQISHHDDFLPYLNRLNLEVIGKVAFNERFNSFSPNEQDPSSRSSKLIAAAFGSNSGIMKLDKGVLWRLFETPLYKKLVKSQTYLEKSVSTVSFQRQYLGNQWKLTCAKFESTIGKKAQGRERWKSLVSEAKFHFGSLSQQSKQATEILVKKLKFFESEDSGLDQSLLDSFLKQDNLDTKDIVGMMVDILMAAIDTTSFSTSFILYHLARNPEVQNTLFTEVSFLLPDKHSDITAEVLSKAVYARCCLKESLRLNPVSIGVGRLLQRDIILGDYLVPKGTVIVAQNMLACRLPQYVRQPLSFKPERWLRGSQHYENLHPFLSLPFGFGPRSCIARRLAEQNMTVFVMRLIREYEIKWVGDELGVRTYLINKPDKPVTFSFTSRQ